MRSKDGPSLSLVSVAFGAYVFMLLEVLNSTHILSETFLGYQQLDSTDSHFKIASNGIS